MDLTNKKSEPDGLMSEENGMIKTCADCGTSKTPLWRGGPAGPKSLCNACGIRSRKKIRVLSSIKSRVILSTKKSSGTGSGINSSGTGSGSNSSGSSTITTSSSKRRGDDRSNDSVGSTGRLLVNQRWRSTVGKRTPRRMKKLGEDEQAAVLLMALSYGSVFA